jgi:hypothetical protein
MMNFNWTGYPILVAMCFVLTACSSTPYKQEVGVFSTSVQTAVDSFETLRVTQQEAIIADKHRGLAASGVRVATGIDCTAFITEKLQKDARCMAQWSEFRAAAGNLPAPNCTEPAFDSATQTFKPYDFAQYGKAEIKECALGILENNELKPELLNAEKLLTNTSLLGQELKYYAQSLAKLVDAKDVDELRSAVGDAKIAVEGLSGEIEKATGSKVPHREAIGPITDLIGSSLTSALEAKRYAALKTITTMAQPVVDQAGAILSRTSMVLMIPDLRSSGTDYLKATEAFNDLPKDDAWLSALRTARRTQAKYFKRVNANPSTTFVAMTKTHAALVEGLDDPKRGFESLKLVLKDFSSKAKAVSETLKPN